MPLRRMIGISLAVLVISTSAIAKTAEKTAPHDHVQRPSPKPDKTGMRSAKIHAVAKDRHGTAAALARLAHATPARRHLAPHHAVADAPARSPDPYWGPATAVATAEIGNAAWYGREGARTASGERLDGVTATAAHRSLPLMSFARVTNLDNGRSVVVKINDRGPFSPRFVIDLSRPAAEELGLKHAGVAAVAVEPVEIEATAASGAMPTVAAYPSPEAAAAH
jgi:rare lipoprotein A (peptidoglycan hydrolase)